MSKKTFYMQKLNRVLSIDTIVSVFYSDWNPSFVSRGESHDFWEVLYVDKGSITIETDTQTFQLPQGGIYFHPPNEYHRHISSADTYPSVGIISFVCNAPILQKLRGRIHYVEKHVVHLLSQILKNGNRIFADVIDEADHFSMIRYKNCDSLSENLFINYLELFILEMLDTSCIDTITPEKASENLLQSNQKKELVNQAIAFIEKNLYNKVTIAELCSELNCSKTSLSLAFKSQTNMTVIQYLNHLKIEKAKEIMKTKALNVTEISNLLNFCNLSYFSNSFKKQVGMYPKEYAKSLKIKNHSYTVAPIPKDLL